MIHSGVASALNMELIGFSSFCSSDFFLLAHCLLFSVMEPFKSKRSLQEMTGRTCFFTRFSSIFVCQFLNSSLLASFPFLRQADDEHFVPRVYSSGHGTSSKNLCPVSFGGFFSRLLLLLFVLGMFSF